MEERGPNGEAGRAEPTSPFLVAYDQKRKILDPLSHQRVLPREPIRHVVLDCPSSSHSLTANPLLGLYSAQFVENHKKRLISRKPEVEIWRKYAQSTF